MACANVLPEIFAVALGASALWEEDPAWFWEAFARRCLELTTEAMLPSPDSLSSYTKCHQVSSLPVGQKKISIPRQRKLGVFLCALVHTLQSDCKQKLAKYFFSPQEIKLGSRPGIWFWFPIQEEFLNVYMVRRKWMPFTKWSPLILLNKGHSCF